MSVKQGDPIEEYPQLLSTEGYLQPSFGSAGNGDPSPMSSRNAISASLLLVSMAHFSAVRLSRGFLQHPERDPIQNLRLPGGLAETASLEIAKRSFQVPIIIVKAILIKGSP